MTVIAYLQAAPGKRDGPLGPRKAVGPTSQQKGYINDDPHQSTEEPDIFVFYENWESDANLDAHLAAPHLTQFPPASPSCSASAVSP